MFPVLLEHLASGAVNLTGARVLAPHMTRENCAELLGAAHYKSKREIEEIVAALQPQPDVAGTVRKLPAAVLKAEKQPVKLSPQSQSPTPPAVLPPQTGSAPAAATRLNAKSVVAPLAAERYKVQFTITRDTRDKLREAQDLMRHQVPNGDLSVVMDKALTVLLEHLRRRRFAETARPRARRDHDTASRHIPAAVKREVWRRDNGRCAFAAAGKRCEERGFLEFHHVVPYAAGGAATVQNIELRCRAHNSYEASLFFGTEQGGESGEK
jgi:hypothetical protein